MALDGFSDGIIKAIDTKFRRSDSKDMVYAEKVYEAVSTGSANIDLAIGDNLGMLVRGKITEVAGMESSGKSTLCYQSAAKAVAEGQIGALFDSEGSFDAGYAAALGLHVGKNFQVFRPVTAEDSETLFNMIFGIGKGNSKTKVNIDFCIWDSITATTPEEMLDSETSTGQGQSKGVHARYWGNFIRKINRVAIEQDVAFLLINQLRNKIEMGNMYQEKNIKTENGLAAGFSSDSSKITTGGMALKYFFAVRLLLQQTKRLKEELGTRNGKPISTKGRINYIRADVIKNKLGIPFKDAMTAIQFGKGFRDELPQFDYLKEELKNGVITSSSSGVYGFDFNGVSFEVKGLANFQKQLFTKYRSNLEEAYIYYKSEEYRELYNLDDEDVIAELLDEDEDIDLLDDQDDVKKHVSRKSKVTTKRKPVKPVTKKRLGR